MRTLKPCGTPSAYKRHLYNNEEPCDPCKAANNRRSVKAPSGNSTSREVLKLEAAMEQRPPVIKWRFDPVRRIQVAWLVDDPYMEHGPSPQRQAGQLRYYAQRKAAS